MPKYLFQASFTAEGAAGVLKEGGTARKAAVEKSMKSLGGKLEAFYFAFGTSDVIGIVDLPDNQSIASISLTSKASGTVSTTITVLLTPEQVDEVSKKSVSYRAPGH